MSLSRHYRVWLALLHELPKICISARKWQYTSKKIISLLITYKIPWTTIIRSLYNCIIVVATTQIWVLRKNQIGHVPYHHVLGYCYGQPKVLLNFLKYRKFTPNGCSPFSSNVFFLNLLKKPFCFHHSTNRLETPLFSAIVF